MGVFDDKKFEGLDWISQATEPIDSQLNEALGLIPESIDVDFSTYVAIAKYDSSPDLTMRNTMSYLLAKYAPNMAMSYDQVTHLRELFKFEFSSNVVGIDFETRSIIGGNIKLTKLASTMDEKVLALILGREGIMKVSICSFYKDSGGRANEIMDVLGKCESGLKSRSERKKRYAIVNRLNEIFKTNEWKIKDTELANKVGLWIAMYIQDGNLAAFSNFCRLKVMTHKDQPIYSMEEVL